MSQTANESIITHYANYIRETSKEEKQPEYEFRTFTVKQLEKLLELVPDLKEDDSYTSVLFKKRYAQKIQVANDASNAEKVDVLREIYEVGEALLLPGRILSDLLYTIAHWQS